MIQPPTRWCNAVLLLVLTAGLLGCESVIEIDLDDSDPVLVVTCVFEPDQPWHATVQRSILPGEPPLDLPVTVEHAVVTIQGDDGSHVRLLHKGGGFYQAPDLPKPGVTYRLQVEAEGYEPVEATNRIPPAIAISGIHFQPISGRKMVRADFQMDAVVGKHYYEIYAIKSTLEFARFRVLNPELEEQVLNFDNNDILNEVGANIYLLRFLFHNRAFEGKDFTVKLAIETKGSKVHYFVRAVSEAYYRYYLTRQLQQRAETNPFQEPIRIQTNLQGGQGIFAGINTRSADDLPPGYLPKMVPGTYHLKAYDARVGGVETNLVDAGARGLLTLRSDHTVTGWLEYPATDASTERVRLSLDGGYLVDGTYIRLFHTSKTVLQDIRFRFDPVKKSLYGAKNQDPSDRVFVRFE